MSAELKTHRRDATLILTFSNPDAKNALHPDMIAAAIETLSTAERDDTVCAVILAGADNFFCSGRHSATASKSHESARYQSEQTDAIDNLHGWIEAIQNCPKPVIAAVEGAAVDTGFSLALACDLIVAGASVKFSMPCISAGLTPDGGASWFLARMLPRQLASEILLEGKTIGAARLHELGLVNKLVMDGEALDGALNWADQLAKLPATAIGLVKSLIYEAQGNSLAEHFEAEKHSFVECLRHRQN